MAVLNFNSINGIIVDVILFFIVAGNAAIGYKRGLVNVIFNICSSLVAIVLVLILYGPITNYIFNNTQLSQTIENTIEGKIGYLFEKNNIQTAEQLEENQDMSELLSIFIGNKTSDLLQQTTEAITQYISSLVTKKIISIVVFFALFAIIRLLLYILKSYIELVANLPIIRVFNGSGGMIYGIIKGLLIIYVLFAIISVTVPMMNSTELISWIESAKFGSKIFHNNILLNLIFRFI